MADDALFIGWGDVVRGRESKSLDVFNESLQYYGQLQQDGKIESFDAWFLAPHGGDLAGFILLRGDRARLDEVQRSADFELLQTRAGMIVDRIALSRSRCRRLSRQSLAIAIDDKQQRGSKRLPPDERSSFKAPRHDPLAEFDEYKQPPARDAGRRNRNLRVVHTSRAALDSRGARNRAKAADPMQV